MTYLEAVAKLPRRERGRWVDGLTIARAGGRYGWRSRISECRTKLGMRVKNRQRKVGRRVVSEYRVTR